MSNPRSIRQKTILLVEDDASILLGLKEVLDGEGFRAVGCQRGDEALSHVQQCEPDLIVLDVMLPGKSGYEVCRELRAEKRRIPILMLTAKGQELDKVIGLDLGADDYVTKPFGVRELVARIHALLRRTGSAVADNGESFNIGDNSINPRTFELSRNQGKESLTAKELKLQVGS